MRCRFGQLKDEVLGMLHDLHPAAELCGEAFEKFDLSYTSATGRWETVVVGLDPSIVHEVVYFAEDREGDLSTPYRTLLVPDSGWGDLYDLYYNDDTTASLNFFRRYTAWRQK